MLSTRRRRSKDKRDYKKKIMQRRKIIEQNNSRGVNIGNGSHFWSGRDEL